MLHLPTPRTAAAAARRLLLATGLLAGLATTAQATTDELRLQGRLDLNVTRWRHGPWELTQASTSRFGLSGRHAVPGSPLQVLFELESGFDADTGAGSRRFWGRESWVGLSGSFGRLRLGRSQTPAQRVASIHDPYRTDGIGSLGSSGLLAGRGELVRFDNGLYYETPDLRGFSAFVATQLREEGAGASRELHSLRLRYRAGPVDASLAHAALGADGALHAAGLNLEVGTVKLLAQHQRYRKAGAGRRTQLLGLVVPTAAATWRLSWSQSASRSNGERRTLLALGGDTALSRRTALYATVAHEARTGRDATHGVECGIRHSF